MSTNRTVVVIPARYASTRLPGKPLISLLGKPMIQWVYERARQIPGVTEVLVATDDQRIARVIAAAGGAAIMTPADIPNGSERVGFVVREMEADIVVNLQGDEPLFSSPAIAGAIRALLEDPDLPVATLGYPLRDVRAWQNPAVVKVVVNRLGNALYFSRAAIPFPRDRAFQPLPVLYRHIGVYVYRKSFLMKFLSWPEGILEQCEKLEQLRILERGYPIKVLESDHLSPGVDTPEDIPVVETALKEKGWMS